MRYLSSASGGTRSVASAAASEMPPYQ